MKVIKGKEYLSTLDIASQYPACDSSIRNWIASGKLTPDLKINLRVYFLRATLDRFFFGQNNQQTKETK